MNKTTKAIINAIEELTEEMLEYEFRNQKIDLNPYEVYMNVKTAMGIEIRKAIREKLRNV